MANAILRRTVEIVRGSLGPALDDITIDRVAIGLFFTGVKLSTGHAGACATPVKDMPEAVCCPSSAMAMPFPGKLRGRRAADLLDEAVEQVGIRRSVGIATLNALAQIVNESRAPQGFEIVEGLDAFAGAEVAADETVVVVGAFVPFLRELRKIGARHWVLEKDPSTLKPHEMPYFKEAERAPDVVPEADVLIITGTTLANDTLGSLIALAKPSARIVVVGPTVTMIPDAFFERGCHILGGIKVTDPDAFFAVIAEGGSGYHFFGKSAVKITLRKSPALNVSGWKTRAIA
ncbi:Rossmann-like domain-containing protein [Shinella sp.]|uniref:Rossmann-like domain-containing protein n=1 Tax=Shinella sp. TaxID=1870904 RepID=UPI003F6E8A79